MPLSLHRPAQRRDMSIGAMSINGRLSAWLAALALFFYGVAYAGSSEDFFIAIKRDDARTVKAWLQKGLSPNLRLEKQSDTPLIVAVREKSMKVFDVLLQTRGVNLEAQAQNGDTALMIAAYNGNFPAVAGLLGKGAQPNRPGWTALHYAAAGGHNDIVQLLLEYSAYIDAESPNKTTPFMMAVWGNHILTVKLLLDQGADARLRNEQGLSALDLARQRGYKDIAEGLTYRLRK